MSRLQRFVEPIAKSERARMVAYWESKGLSRADALRAERLGYNATQCKDEGRAAEMWYRATEFAYARMDEAVKAAELAAMRKGMVS